MIWLLNVISKYISQSNIHFNLILCLCRVLKTDQYLIQSQNIIAKNNAGYDAFHSKSINTNFLLKKFSYNSVEN